MKLKATIFLLGGLFWTGCGYELPKTANAADNSANSAAQVNRNANNQSGSAINAGQSNKDAATADSKTAGGNAEEEKLILTSSGESTTFPCNGREVEVDESVTASTYTLTGECKKLTVDGVTVTVNVEKVGEIVVTGVSNKVIYGEGIKGKKPKITKSGPSVTVESKAEAEKREAQNQIK